MLDTPEGVTIEPASPKGKREELKAKILVREASSAD